MEGEREEEGGEKEEEGLHNTAMMAKTKDIMFSKS